MEQPERGVAARSQNVVHVMPRTAEGLARIVSAPLERVDPTVAALQLLIVTPDAESAVAIGETVHAMTGAQGIEIIPVTSANRAARIVADRPVHALAGTADELVALVSRSVIKLDAIRTIVLAWIDTDSAATPASRTSLDSIFSELPKTAARIAAVRRVTPEVEQVVEQHLRNARRIWGNDSAGGETVGRIVPSSTPVQYVSVSPSSRPAALRRLLDEIDPPSVAIVVRDAAAEADAIQTVRSLGYRRTDDPVRVVRYGAITAAHTIVLYDSPVMPTELAQAAAVTPVQIVAFATPRDMIALHELIENLVPLSLEGPGVTARSRESAIRAELVKVLGQGMAARELITLEPLLDNFDGIEIAAAALRLLESERAARSNVRSITRSDAPPPREDRAPRPPRGDSGDRKRDGSFGGPRRDKPPSREGGRPREDRGGRGAPSGERRERNLGRGPRSGAGGSSAGGRDNDRRGGPGARRPPRPFER